jgi:hypothetical protein
MTQLPEEPLYIDPSRYDSNHKPTKYPTNQGDHYLIRRNEATKEELCKPAYNSG